MKTNPFPILQKGVVITSILFAVSSASGVQPVPVFLKPAAHSTATTSPVDIRIAVDGIENGNFLKVRSNGQAIGYASPLNFYGEWPFTDGSHLSVMTGTPDVIVDYHPPGGGPMFFFDGKFTSRTHFAGTFTHWNGVDPDPLTGDVTIDFSTSKMGLLNVKIVGDSPLGTHNSGGAWSGSTTYQFLWKNPPNGAHTLSAVANWTDAGTSKTYATESAPLSIQVNIPKVPEISVQQPQGKDLKDGKGATNFGRVKVGRKVGKTFVIKNKGTAKLKGLKVSLNGRSAGDYRITQPKSKQLAPGRKTTFKVAFRPKSKGLKVAAVKVRSNDADENPFDIKLKGKGK